MRDGVVLRADVYRPDEDGTHPVLLCRLPYGKHRSYELSMLMPTYFAQQGFIVVLQDTRGRFRSEGNWEPMATENEDGYDTVMWASTLPGSSGHVFMYGLSYFGATQFAAAGEQPGALTAIAPMFTTETLFPPELIPTHHWSPWDLAQGIEEIRRRYQDDPEQLQQKMGALTHDLSNLHTELYPADQDRASALERHALPHRQSLRLNSRPTTPALNIGGWFDIFVDGTIESFMDQRSRGVPSRLVIGPWTHVNQSPHVGDMSFGVGADMNRLRMETNIWELQRDWFRSHLEDAGSASEIPPVEIFVMGDNVWRTENEWPLARAVTSTMYLGTNGVLLEEQCLDPSRDSFTHRPRTPVPTVGGATLMEAYAAGPLRQDAIETREDVLTYTTTPLAHDLEVTGHPVITLDVESTATSADWVVRLCDVDPDGHSVLITDGIVRSEGDRQMHAVSLLPTSWVFKRRHSIRVQVSSSSYPRWLPNFAGADPQSDPRFDHHVWLGTSRIELPVVPRDDSGDL
ncbi:CocE/NonD family hydrolase [Microbacterium sp.]|uniref:CocE/NonD family hydrolase n=1 Tax=Microbacterium sp. TaxID=51671 RepID=UPI003A9489BE